MSFQSRLKKLRLEKKLTQQDVAEKLGITRQAYGYYESEKSKREPDLDATKKLAEIFEVTTDYLLTGSNISTQSEKEEKDIAKRMEKIRRDLSEDDGYMLMGEPISEEAKESILDAMEYAIRQATRINKKYIPKKYRGNQD
jgi:transcriptional regulator with XRE-family HTH domain